MSAAWSVSVVRITVNARTEAPNSAGVTARATRTMVRKLTPETSPVVAKLPDLVARTRRDSGTAERGRDGTRPARAASCLHALGRPFSSPTSARRRTTRVRDDSVQEIRESTSDLGPGERLRGVVTPRE